MKKGHGITHGKDISVARGRNLETDPEVEGAGHSGATKVMVKYGRGQDKGCVRLTTESLRRNIIQKNEKV